jgi:hypothetical protein
LSRLTSQERPRWNGELVTARFRINSPHVVSETLEGEATIVDLESGTYYALNESGSLIWNELIAGADAQDAAQTLASTYGLGPDEAARAVEQLTGQLAEATLIVPAASDSNGSQPKRADQGSTEAANGKSYATPQLSTYTDMQELLLLDPIHEVDESGWPTPG